MFSRLACYYYIKNSPVLFFCLYIPKYNTVSSVTHKYITNTYTFDCHFPKNYTSRVLIYKYYIFILYSLKSVYLYNENKIKKKYECVPSDRSTFNYSIS